MHKILTDILVEGRDELPRLFIFVGAYGSGKSEVAVNFARMLRESLPDRKLLLADLDIVNPFFRSADAADILAQENIRLIAPNYANTNVDAPTVSGEMYSIFDDPSYTGVFDIGGEDLGAKILASMSSRFRTIAYRVYMVVNTCRPFTADAEGIAKMSRELEIASRLKIDGFINNTNLLEMTTTQMIVESQPILEKATELTGIPVAFYSGFNENLKEFSKTSSNFEISLLSMQRSVLYNS